MTKDTCKHKDSFLMEKENGIRFCRDCSNSYVPQALPDIEEIEIFDDREWSGYKRITPLEIANKINEIIKTINTLKNNL